ncbi:hypothetical protein [Petrachloros mirabilis]
MVRSLFIVGTWCAMAGFLLQACAGSQPGGVSTETLQTPEGFAAWKQREEGLLEEVLAARKSYKREDSLDTLKGYEDSVREYLDHGFELYRTYRDTHHAFPPGLVSSLEQRTGLFMDVADEYIKHGSIPVGESIAAVVVRDYSDLPTLAPAQRRAEAVLLRYRYRQDY